jgi:hypothetical protein
MDLESGMILKTWQMNLAVVASKAGGVKPPVRAFGRHGFRFASKGALDPICPIPS